MAGLKERIRRLDRYQKGVMLVVAAMTIVFTFLYPVTILRVGFEYNDSILVPERIDGGTVYSGRVGGERASFTVNTDGTWNSSAAMCPSDRTLPARTRVPSRRICARRRM